MNIKEYFNKYNPDKERVWDLISLEAVTAEKAFSFLDAYIKFNPSEGKALKNILKRADWDKNHLRKGRTYKQYTRDMKKHTEDEGLCMKRWAEEQLKPRNIKIKYVDHGVDNSGKIVYESSKIGNADYLYSLNDKPMRPLEIKPIRPINNPKATFKVKNLEDYIKQKADMLLLFDVEKPVKKRSKIRAWTLVKNKVISELLKIPQDCSIASFGYKPCVVIGPGRWYDGKKSPIPFEDFFEVYDWEDLNKNIKL